MKSFCVDQLRVNQYETRAEMGKAAAKEVANKIVELLSQKKEIKMIFAAAPSQNEFLQALMEDKSVDFSRIQAFHMDEYIGLSKEAPQGFGNFLKDRLFSKVPFQAVNYMNGQAENPKIECERYAKLLQEGVDIVCMGIGENAHIAFNDPHIAFFHDSEAVKIVELDEVCRNQQVNDGCFQTIEQVPTHAVTLTIPTLMKADFVYCMVPAKNKAKAVKQVLRESVQELYPASILRTHKNAVLYIDGESGSLV